MSIYLIAQLDIHDRTAYEKYTDGFMEVFRKFQGEVLAADDHTKLLEGDWPYTRTVLLRFPSEDAARDWYESDAYQALLQHRLAGAKANVVIVQGFPGSS